jgi:putative transposase
MDSVSQIKRMLDSFGGAETEELTSAMMRLGFKRLVEEFLEAEVSEFLGRDPYERRPEGSRGYRNGYKQRRVDSAEGRVLVDVPQVRDAEQTYQSRLWQTMRRRTEILEKLVVEMYVRGLSTRDIEDTLRALGEGLNDDQSLLSSSSVSRLTEVLWEEYEAFAERELSGFDVVYLFCDAVYESLRQQAKMNEAVLVTWGILKDGRKVLIHMSLGNKESADDWLEHLRDMVRRGLPTPLTVTTDGAAGLIKAVETMWPESERIRCWVHRMRNVLDKVPEDVRPELKAHLQDIRDAPSHSAGERRLSRVIDQYESRYPSAIKSLKDDMEASLAHLKLPHRHQRSIRTTNLVERSFEEERRRAKVLPRFRTERECLKLVFGVLWRASERWQRVTFSEHEQRQLQAYQDLKKQRREAKRKKVNPQKDDATVAL